MKKQKQELKLVKREITEKDLGFRIHLEPCDYLTLRDYAEKHDVKMSDVVLSALRQCGVLTAPFTTRHGTGGEQ